MLKYFIQLVEQDSTISEEEKEERKWKLFDYWITIRKKLRRLLKKLQKESKRSLEYEVKYFCYWIHLKLICEGEDVSVENILGCDLIEVKDFITRVILEAGCDENR